MIKRRLRVTRALAPRLLTSALAALALFGCAEAEKDEGGFEDAPLATIEQALCAAQAFTGVTATASSSQSTSFAPSFAVDNNTSTRWSSTFSDVQWLRLDLGQVRYVGKVSLSWETASAADYRIELSTDGSTWATAKAVTGMATGPRTDVHADLSVHEARYVRISMTRRNTTFGYSLFEAKVFGDTNLACDLHDVTKPLEAENNSGIRPLSVQFEPTADSGGGLHATGIDAGDWIEWKVRVPQDGKYTLTTRSATWAQTSLWLLFNGARRAVISMPSTWDGTGSKTETWRTFSSGELDVRAGTYVVRAEFQAGAQGLSSQNLNWIAIAPSRPACGNFFIEEGNLSEGRPFEQCDDGNTLSGDGCSSACIVEDLAGFGVGLFRIVSSARSTVTSDDATGKLAGAPYGGRSQQHFRFQRIGAGRYDLVNEWSGACVVQNVAQVGLASCGGDNTGSWSIDTVQSANDWQPAVYRLRHTNGSCIAAGSDGFSPVLTPCSSADARLFLEPVGMDERVVAPQFELRGLMIIKPVTHVDALRVHGEFTPAQIESATKAYKERLATLFRRMSDGRIVWKGEVVVSPDTLTSLRSTGLTPTTNAWYPLPEDMPSDVSRYISPGRYDFATVLFHEAILEGYPTSLGSFHPYHQPAWVTLPGGRVPAGDWLTTNETADALVRGLLDGMIVPYITRGVAPLEGELSPEEHGYVAGPVGYLHWFRDYLNGRVLDSAGSYRGFGPRAFLQGVPRDLGRP